MAFKSKVKPVAGLSIGWEALIKDTFDLTGLNPNSSMDGSNYHFSTFAKMVVALESLKSGSKVQPLHSLSVSSASLNHLFFSFLILTSSSLVLKLSEETTLHILSSPTKVKSMRLAYVSGTLSQWKTMVISLSNHNNTELRFIANSCLGFFSEMGLKHIFQKYVQKQLNDGTYLLEYKQ
ncbi:MAG: hypothetical protein WC942_03685 [Clostridia bacterium]|jgi:hypothetical protein